MAKVEGVTNVAWLGKALGRGGSHEHPPTMKEDLLTYGLAQLRSAFLENPIKASEIEASQGQQERLVCELKVSGIEGISWSDITAVQARGSWDLLFYTSPQSLPTLLPGFMQWLLHPEEADVMLTGLPKILLSALEHHRDAFTVDQLAKMSEFMLVVLAQVKDVDPEDYFILTQCYFSLTVAARTAASVD